MIKDVGEDEGLDGWVQEKIIKANDYLNTIREYLEGKQLQTVDEADDSGSNYAEKLAQYVYNVRPALNSEDDVLNIGYKVAVQDLASQTRAVSLFSRDQDFPSDFVSAYRFLQKRRGMVEGEQRVDSLVTDALKIVRGSDFQVDAVKALKTVLGDREYNSRRGFYSFYVKQLMDMLDQEGLAEGNTEVRDNTGKVVSWRNDTEWHKAEKNKQGQPKDPRGIVTHLSDVARRKTEKQDTKEGKIDFTKKIQKNVDKSNKAVVKTKKEVGSRVADIGAGGKEYNVKTDKAWDDAQKAKKAK
jgi:hypothetical protein